MGNRKYIFFALLMVYSCNKEPDTKGLANEMSSNTGNEMSENVDFQYDKYKTVHTIGEEQKNLIGFVKEVVVDKFGKIYVLDDRQQKVFVYDEKGGYKETLGGRGSGPGELTYAKSLTVYQDSLLLISNRYRIEEYTISEDSTHFNRTVELNKNIKSICSAGDELFIHNGDLIRSGAINENEQNANMIHSVRVPGYDIQYSFGASYSSDSPVMIERLSLGRIFCSRNNHKLTYVSDRLNTIHGYSKEDGELIWESSIHNLNFPKFEEIMVNGNPGLQMVPSENNVFDTILSPVILNNDVVLIQVDRREVTNPETFESNVSVLTFLADLKNGKISRYEGDFGRILYVSDNLLLEVNELFNKVYVKRVL